MGNSAISATNWTNKAVQVAMALFVEDDPVILIWWLVGCRLVVHAFLFSLSVYK
jgi:hypothetical protein